MREQNRQEICFDEWHIMMVCSAKPQKRSTMSQAQWLQFLQMVAMGSHQQEW